jgi:hypothetical protein
MTEINLLIRFISYSFGSFSGDLPGKSGEFRWKEISGLFIYLRIQ